MGWWNMESGEEPGLFNGAMAEDKGLRMGDTPADIMSNALDEIIREYEAEFGRMPYREELLGAFNFVIGGLEEAGDIKSINPEEKQE